MGKKWTGILLALVLVLACCPGVGADQGLEPLGEDYREVMYYYRDDMVYSYSWYWDYVVNDWNDAFALAGPPQPANPNAEKEMGILWIGSNYEKRDFFLTEEGLLTDGMAYVLPQETKECLLVQNEGFYEEAYFPQWLVRLNPYRVRDVLETANWGIDNINALRYISVERDSLRLLKSTVGRIGMDVQITLVIGEEDDEPVYLCVGIKGDQLYLDASNVEFGCQYTLRDSEIEKEWFFIPYEIEEIDPIPDIQPDKPVIYLYPETTRDISVKLHFDGSFTYTFPDYGDGWRVRATPDGTLTNLADGTTHYYLFWEGKTDKQYWNFDTGFVVAGADTEGFLREKLSYMGLTPKEYNDFITFWVPQMQGNPYNLIHFAGEEYDRVAPLEISPEPDSVLRINMVYRGLEQPVSVPEQPLKPFTRSGFTVVEWGGTAV